MLLDEKKNECVAVAVGMFSKLLKLGKPFISQLSSMEIGPDFFFKKAPIVPKAVTTLVIGYPAVKYHRTPHRKPLNLIKA